MRLEDFPAPNPDFERLRRVIMREEEPDRIALFDIQIDPEIMEAIMGESIPAMMDADPEQIQKKLSKDIELAHRLGYDFVTVWNMPILPGNFVFAEDTATLSRGVRPWQDESGGPIASKEDVENFPWPDLSGKKYTRYEFATEHMPEGMRIIAVLPGVFETVRGLMGVTGLCYKLTDDPSLVADVFERVGQVTLEAVSNLSALEGVGAVVLADDIAFNTGLMMSPDHFREHVLPWNKKISQTIHEKDKLFILHACGRIEMLMEDLISDVGIDARHSYEDQITPIEEAKRLYGDRIAVLGGVDMDLLTRGSEEDVRKRVREILAVCAPGGGFALGAGNSAANFIRPENFLAMLDEGLKFSA